jgi:hypothetical protein
MTNGTKRTSDQTFTYAIIRHLEKKVGKKSWKKCKLNENYYFECS